MSTESHELRLFHLVSAHIDSLPGGRPAGVWTAIRADNGGLQHLTTIEPGRPTQVRTLTGSTPAWLRTLRRA
jgi:hypothetical protein